MNPSVPEIPESILDRAIHLIESRDPIDNELDRLEGIGNWNERAEDWRAKMWRRSYCVALNAIKSLEARLTAARRISQDAPMVFFYPEPER